MKSVVLALAAAAWLGVAASSQAAPAPAGPRPMVLPPRLTPVARPGDLRAPSQVSGYIVYKDPTGRLRPSNFYPNVQARFVRTDITYNGAPIVYKVALFDAGAGLAPVHGPDGGTVAYRYSFGLSADRLARDYNGAPGVERDPERANSIRFNPDTLRYDGIEVTLLERWYDPNLRRDDDRSAIGVVRATPYEDTVGFTR
jgi:hypothetical protein